MADSSPCLAFFQRVQGFCGGAAEGAAGIYLEDFLKVAAGAGSLVQGGEGRGPVVVGDAQPGVELYGQVGGFEGGAGVARCLEAGPECRVVAGEGAARRDLIVELGRPFVLASAEGRSRPSLVRGDRAGHQGRQDGGAAEVDEQDGAVVLDGREVHHEGQTRDKDTRGKGRYQAQEEVPVGPHAQQVPVLTADQNHEDHQDGERAERRIEQSQLSSSSILRVADRNRRGRSVSWAFSRSLTALLFFPILCKTRARL